MPIVPLVYPTEYKATNQTADYKASKMTVGSLQVGSNWVVMNLMLNTIHAANLVYGVPSYIMRSECNLDQVLHPSNSLGYRLVIIV
jgi:hypothetical protein